MQPRSRKAQEVPSIAISDAVFVYSTAVDNKVVICSGAELFESLPVLDKAVSSPRDGIAMD
jgi:hypothetical protein